MVASVARFYFEQNNARSSQWRIWSNKDDLYVSTRNAGHLFKASLHQSGYLNFSLTKEYYDDGDGNIEPMPDSRHLGYEKLNIHDTDIQLVLCIQIPVKWMSNCTYNKTSKAKKIVIAPVATGTVVVKIMHVPVEKRHLIKGMKIDNLIEVFCDNKYLVCWQLHETVELNDYNTKKNNYFGDVSFDENTRAVTVGYSVSNEFGFLLDTTFKKQQERESNPHGGVNPAGF